MGREWASKGDNSHDYCYSPSPAEFMFVESTLQHEYLSVQMPTNSPGENISRSANHIYVNCAKYLSNLYSNCEFRFIAFRGPFPACSTLCALGLATGGRGGGGVNADDDGDQAATLQFHANLDISTNATATLANKPMATSTRTSSSSNSGVVEAPNGHDLSSPDRRRRPLKDILAKVRRKSYFYE